MTDFQFVNTDIYDQGPLASPSTTLFSENRYFCAICDQKLNDVYLKDDELTQRFKTTNGFTCNICYKVYHSLKMLKEHQIDHFKDKDFKVACVGCTNRSKTFDNGATLDEMYTKNDVRSELLCEICNRYCHNKNQYLRHIRDHYDRTVYICDYCKIKIIGWERWNIHNKTTNIHEIKEVKKDVTSYGASYKCGVCAAVIPNISEFQKHFSHCQSTNLTEPKLTDGDSVYCGICGVEMLDIREIKQKLETDKPDKSDYYRTNFDSINCLMCYKPFKSIGDLKHHQIKDHFESKYEKRFACLRCINKTNKFGQVSKHTNSAKTTSKENNFCSICDKFIQAAFWSRHVRNHRDRVVYQCETCHKVRIGSIRFQNHLSQSSKCSIGSMRLQNHLRQIPTDCESDNGAKEILPKNNTYQCGKCKRTFSLRRSFKMHIDESDCYKENHCRTCLKRFITKKSLDEHYLAGGCLTVENTSNFDCTECAKSFLTRKGCILHSKICQKSVKEKTVFCDICKISVECGANHWNDIHRRKAVVKLKRSKNVERTTNPSNKCSTVTQFGCLLCEDTFCSRQELIGHMKVHYCDKAVQTTSEDQCEVNLDVMDSDSKQLVTSNLKDERLELSPRVEIYSNEVENKFDISNEIIKTEDTFDDMWSTNFADDDPGEINVEFTDNDAIGTVQNNVLGMTSCCLCNTIIPDLVNTDDVVQQQISTYGECICQICFQVFNKIEKLREHESTHFQDNLDGHQIACRLCSWSSNVYYTDGDFFRLEKDLQCYMCSTKMCDIRTLRRHKRSHLSLCVFTCKVCNKKSISDERHRSHLRKHQKPEFTVVTNKIARKCTLCGDEANHLFRDEKDIDKMFEKFGGGPCKICFTYINDKRRYISHERSHMEEQQLVSCFKCCNTQHYTDDEYHKLEDELKCFICNAKLSSLYNLHLHKRKHLDRVVYSCTHCLALVVGTRNHSHHLYKHGLRKKNREEESGQFECHYCQKVFPHKSSLPAHFKQHLNKERVPCTQCKLTFASKGNLTQHIKQIHLNIRKHICELCGKAFGHPHNLKSHMVKHSGEKPYQCPICLKRFGYYSRMKTHAWIHSGLKPYKCDQCDKCYNDSTDLRRHKRIHGGVEKKFECELCKIKFYEHKYLRAHRASAHKFLVQ